MELNEAELKLLIQEAVGIAFENHTTEFYVDPESHYQDHLLIRGCAENQDEMRKNHEFTAAVRDGTDILKKRSVVVLVTTAIGFFIWMMVEAVRHWVSTT